MKHIKTFENTRYGSYWLLPTDDRFEKSLKSINCPKDVMESRFLYNHDLRYYNKYVFIGRDNISWGWNPYKWGWKPYKGEKSDDYYQRFKYKFKGMINIEDYELESEKYNL
jgi:hypothetical protein